MIKNYYYVNNIYKYWKCCHFMEEESRNRSKGLRTRKGRLGSDLERERARSVTTDKSCVPGPSAVGTGFSTKTWAYQGPKCWVFSWEALPLPGHATPVSIHFCPRCWCSWISLFPLLCASWHLWYAPKVAQLSPWMTHTKAVPWNLKHVFQKLD